MGFVILWNILKVIGFIILTILALLLLIILFLLCSPICYYVAGDYIEEVGGKFDVKWILGAIHVYGAYEKGEIKLSLKLFGYCVYGTDKKQKENKKENTMLSIRRKQEPEEQNQEQQEQKQEQELPKKQPQEQKQSYQKIETELQKTEKTKQKQKKVSQKSTKKREKKIKKENNKYKEIITYVVQHKRELLKGVIAFCKRILKGILPKHCCVKATIGTGDPALTGYILGIAGAAKIKFQKLQITGDFTQKIVKDVFLEVKGHILLVYLLYAVLRLILIKSVRELIMIVWKGYGDKNG